MLQYPVPLPPLSLSSPKSNSTTQNSAGSGADYFRTQHAPSPSPARPTPPPPPHSSSSTRSVGSLSGSASTSKRAAKPPRAHAFAPFAHNLPPLNIPAYTSDRLPSPPATAAPKPSSPKPVPRSPYISAATPWPTTGGGGGSTPDSRRSSRCMEDVLAPGDRVGPGATMKGEEILPAPGDDDGTMYEVQRRLGHGSYAVVYLVREVLSASPASDDGHGSVVGSMDMGSPCSSSSGHGLQNGHEYNGNGSSNGLHGTGLNGLGGGRVEYGREFAIKCLSKANLDQDALEAQLNEVSIHQSLRPHPNIVTLHRTLETPSFLLILLEYVPGEDLFYFLEQARDHAPSSPSASPAPPDPASTSTSATPPTPSLLGSDQLLAPQRLRLIARMFAQMCDAVGACHEQRVFHRDIKPENFIVTETRDGGGEGERRVLVKLTDFGLSTTDEESGDMDCGSAPYMSYECRNNVAPTYAPRQADVWSLGIVLINMLYHYNPWTDTAQGACPSFDLYLQQPVVFFTQRFAGMTKPVAEFLAHRVFPVPCLPPGAALSAREFGMWARELPALLGGDAGPQAQHRRTSSTGHPIIVGGASHRPASRASHRPGSRAASTPRSRTASIGAVYAPELERPPVIGPALEEDAEGEDREQDGDGDGDGEGEGEGEDGPPSRSQSNKRRKRGARKGKNAATATTPASASVHTLPQSAAVSVHALPQTPATPHDVTAEMLAHASQSLAREISRASRTSTGSRGTRASAGSRSTGTGTSRGRAPRSPPSPPSMYPLPFPYVPTDNKPPRPLLPPSAPSAGMSKKPSKWRLNFGGGSKSTSNAATQANDGNVSPIEDIGGADSASGVRARVGSSSVGTGSGSGGSDTGKQMSATASNVTNLIMGLNAPAPAPSSNSSASDRDRERSAERSRSRSRGRAANRARPSEPVPPLPRAFSPATQASLQSHAGAGSGSWRNSMASSSAGTSTSAFTRYSNSSRNSVSTMATSVSASSWRTGGSNKPGPGAHGYGGAAPPTRQQPHPQMDPKRTMPKNIKFMTGVPWELDELPRGMTPSPTDHKFSQPPAQRKPRAPRAKPKDPLDTITERPGQRPQLADAMTSTTELDDDEPGGGGAKKVNHGQITALAKMLSALRR